MNINYNETFLDENSLIYNYYIGIPNLETDNISEIENLLKMYKKKNLDYLSLNIFNFSIHSYEAKHIEKDIIEIINKFIVSLTKRYRITFLFSYSISANPVAYFDCWNSKTIFKGDIKSVKELSDYLITDKSAFLTIKKPHRGILSLSQTEILKSRLCSVEICSLTDDCSIRDFENIYYSLLDKGWRIGAISSLNSTDLKGWYTGIISRHNYQDMLINSIREKFTYSTSITDLKMYFSVNFIPMGKILEIDSMPVTLSFYIFVDISNKIIDTIEIISNNKKIIKEQCTSPLSRIHYVFKYTMAENNTWFVVRLLGNNEVLAISSPVFIQYKKSIS